MVVLLISKFEEVEVKEVISECGGDKSLDPDGFNLKFIKVFWETMKGDIMRFLVEFYEKDFFSER